MNTLENCSEEEQEAIEKLKEKSVEDLNMMVLAEAKEREQTQTDFKEGVEKLQKKYEELSAGRDATLDDIKKKYNIGFVKQLIKSSVSQEEESQEAEESEESQEEESQETEESEESQEEESQRRSLRG